MTEGLVTCEKCGKEKPVWHFIFFYPDRPLDAAFVRRQACDTCTPTR